MTNWIITFSGKAGSGKDTCLRLLKQMIQDEIINLYELSFATSLKWIVKDMTRLFLNIDLDIQQMNDLEYKERVYENLIYCSTTVDVMTVRKLLQTIGDDILKRHLGPSIFSNVIIDKIKTYFENTNKDNIVFINDLRYITEWEMLHTIKDTKILHILVNREQSCQHNHSSEKEYNQIPMDIIIDNNGTLDDLQNYMKDIVIKYIMSSK